MKAWKPSYNWLKKLRKFSEKNIKKINENYETSYHDSCFGWAKVFKFHLLSLLSCLLHGQKLKLVEVYLNPNIARFDKISTSGDSKFNFVMSICQH